MRFCRDNPDSTLPFVGLHGVFSDIHRSVQKDEQTVLLSDQKFDTSSYPSLFIVTVRIMTLSNTVRRNSPFSVREIYEVAVRQWQASASSVANFSDAG
jgi:hypothetical protein